MKRKVYLGLINLSVLFSLSFVLAIGNIQAQTKKQIQTAQKLWEQGDKLHKQKKYDQAIQKFSEAIKVLPEYPSAFYSRGVSYYELGQYDPAISDLTTSLNQKHNATDVYKFRWRAYFQKKETDAALADILEVLKTEPSNGELNKIAGDIYFEKKSESDALNYYKKVSDSYASNADFQYNLAVLYSKTDDFDAQGVAAQRAISNATKYPGEAWYLLGDAQLKAKKYEEAAEAYERAILAKPDIPDAYDNLTMIYQRLSRFNDAISTSLKALKLNPNEGKYYVNMSRYYLLLDQPKDAITVAKQAVNLSPKDYQGFTNLCRAYKDTDQYDLALQACNNAIMLNSVDGETLLYLGQVYDLQKKTNTATDYYKKAVAALVESTKSNPEYGYGFYLLGTGYYLVGQIPNAITAYRTSLQLSPKFARTVYNLGYMYVLSKNKTAAREQYDILQKLNLGLAERLLQEIQGK